MSCIHNTLSTVMENYCRTCGGDIFISEAVHLFEPRRSIYVSQIELITGLQLSHLKHLPVYMCAICTTSLLQATLFRKQCISSESKHQSQAALFGDHKDPLYIELELVQQTKVDLKEQAKIQSDARDELSEHNFQHNRYQESPFALKPLVNDDQDDADNDQSSNFHNQRIHFFKPNINSNKVKCSEIALTSKTTKYQPEDISQKKCKPTEKVAVCEKCGKSVQKRNIEIHLLRHSGIKNYQCELCNSRFYTNYYLKLHIRKRHRNATNENEILLIDHLENKLLCDSTAKIRNTRPRTAFVANEWDISSRIETERKNFQLSCDECGKVYKVRRDLELHILRHKGIKNYECEHCKARFYSANLLKLHAIRHTEPFKCRYCDETFGYNYSRKRHERLHTNERPFECQFCDKRFMCSTSLKDHEVKHTGALNYQCEICDLRFSMNKTLHAHLRSKAHKNIVVNQLKSRAGFSSKEVVNNE